MSPRTVRLPDSAGTGRAVALCCVLVALDGCATARFYPVCVIDAGYEMPEALWVQSAPELGRLVDQTTRSRRGAPLVTSTGAIVWATPREHEELGRVWPSFACVVSSCAGVVGEQLVGQCRASMEKYLSADEWDGRGWSAGTPLRCARAEMPCGTPPGSGNGD